MFYEVRQCTLIFIRDSRTNSATRLRQHADFPYYPTLIFGATLEPVGGFENEPMIRVAGVVAPVSRRHAVIDSIARLSRPLTDSTVPSDSLPDRL